MLSGWCYLHGSWVWAAPQLPSQNSACRQCLPRRAFSKHGTTRASILFPLIPRFGGYSKPRQVSLVHVPPLEAQASLSCACAPTRSPGKSLLCVCPHSKPRRVSLLRIALRNLSESCAAAQPEVKLSGLDLLQSQRFGVFPVGCSARLAAAAVVMQQETVWSDSQANSNQNAERECFSGSLSSTHTPSFI